MGNLCSSNGGDHDGNNSNSERYNVIGKKKCWFFVLFCFLFWREDCDVQNVRKRQAKQLAKLEYESQPLCSFSELNVYRNSNV